MTNFFEYLITNYENLNHAGYYDLDKFYINNDSYFDDINILSRKADNYAVYQLCYLNTSNKTNYNHIERIYSCKFYDLNKLLELPKFMIVRLGHMGSDTLFPFYYATDNLYNRNDEIYNKRLQLLHQEAGVYPINDYNVIETFCRCYIDAIKNATCVKIWNINFLPELYLTKLNGNIITGYPFSDNNWYEYFKGKRVLIVSSHVDTMKDQWYSNNLFKSHNKSITHLDTGIKLTFIKAYVSNGNLYPHDSYLKTLKILMDDISNVVDEFDYALISCGAYGLPICNHIYQYLNKSAVYIGGTLQTFFSIKGKRWDNTNIYNEYWTEVPENCRPQNYKLVEDGCYY